MTQAGHRARSAGAASTRAWTITGRSPSGPSRCLRACSNGWWRS